MTNAKQLTIFDKAKTEGLHIAPVSSLSYIFYNECLQHYQNSAIFTSKHCYLARQKVYKSFIVKYGRHTVKKVKLIKKIIDNLEVKAAQKVNGINYTPPIRF